MAESASYTRRSFSGGSSLTALASGINNSDTTITVSDGSSYAGLTNFRITINEGEATEEEVEVGSVSGNTFSSCVRGVGGTTAASHIAGEAVEHTSSKRDFDEANYAVSETVGQITAANQILVSDAANSLSAVDVAASRIVGRTASGNVDDLTAAQVKTILAITGSDVSSLTSSNISDFATAVDERARDAVGTALTAGTGIAITPNDGADTITVAASFTFTSYTPTLNQAGAVACSVAEGWYCQIGKLVHGYAYLVASAAGSSGTQIKVGLPVVAAMRSSRTHAIGSHVYLDLGTAFYPGTAILEDTDECVLYSNSTSSAIGTSPALAVASGDIIRVQFMYEAA